MEDQKIIALYFQRAETAISETKNKYSRLLLVLLSCSFSLPVLGNQLLLLSDAVDWFLTPTARRFSKGSNHSLFVTLLIS